MIRVLVVDDHPVLRAGLEAVLRAEPGFACTGTAASSAGLWRQLRPRPDVVLLDLRLGGEDGIRICEQIVSEPGAPSVLLYTARPDSDLEAAARAAGAYGVLDKALPVERLFDELRLAARAGRPKAQAA